MHLYALSTTQNRLLISYQMKPHKLSNKKELSKSVYKVQIYEVYTSRVYIKIKSNWVTSPSLKPVNKITQKLKENLFVNIDS